MTRSSKNEIQVVSITIQWRVGNAKSVDGDVNELRSEINLLRHRPKYEVEYNRKKNGFDKRSLKHRDKRLQASDRIVLNALCAHLPPGKRITTPVPTRELMAACELSRRQVQICLRRLVEKGMISRLITGTVIGSQEGYRFRIFKRSDSKSIDK